MDIVEYEDKLIKTFELVDGVQIIKGLNLIREAWINNHVIFTCGNGGSGSIAEHFALDLIKTANKIPSVKAISLVSNTPWITAISNDISYDKIFSEQLRVLSNDDDLLICFSGSGKSQNILNAIGMAGNRNVKTLSFTGYDGGKVKLMNPLYNIHVPSNDMMMVENVFSILCHFLTLKLRNNESVYVY